MLQGQKQNFHGSKLPEIGETGYLIKGYSWLDEPIYLNGYKAKFKVIGFNLFDSPTWFNKPLSLGIHTVLVENLANGEIKQVSGFYFEPDIIA